MQANHISLESTCIKEASYASFITAITIILMIILHCNVLLPVSMIKLKILDVKLRFLENALKTTYYASI